VEVAVQREHGGVAVQGDDPGRGASDMNCVGAERLLYEVVEDAVHTDAWVTGKPTHPERQNQAEGRLRARHTDTMIRYWEWC